MKHLYRIIVFTSVITLSAMTFSTPIFGQRVGERLRVTTDKGLTLIGNVTSVDQATNSFSLAITGGGLRTVEVASIVDMYQSLGIQDKKKKGFFIGLASGTALGVLVGMALAEECQEVDDIFGDLIETDCGGYGVRAALIGTVIYGGGFGLIGLGIGHFMRSEKWEQIPIPGVSSRVRISPFIRTAQLRGDKRTMLGAHIHF